MLLHVVCLQVHQIAVQLFHTSTGCMWASQWTVVVYVSTLNCTQDACSVIANRHASTAPVAVWLLLIAGSMFKHQDSFWQDYIAIVSLHLAVRLYDRRMSLQRGHSQSPSGRSWPQWVSCFIPTSLKTDTMQPRTGTERCCSCCTACQHQAYCAVVMCSGALASLWLCLSLWQHFADVTGLLQAPVLNVLRRFACTFSQS